MDYEMIECGACASCETKARIAAIVSEVDQVFQPRIDAIRRSWDALPYRDEHDERNMRRQIKQLVYERGRWIEYITAPLLPLSGCYRLVIRQRSA